jgi:hypothetical protein
MVGRLLRSLWAGIVGLDDFYKVVIAGNSTSVPLVEGGDDTWAAQMGWHYVAYREGGEAISLSIEPMVRGADVVYTPDDEKWAQSAPAWARTRRGEILERLKSVAWNRELTWRESSKDGLMLIGRDMNHVIPGSVEGTWGGQRLEALRLYNPGSSTPLEEVRELWNRAALETVKGARGRVNLFVSEDIPDSVFQSVIMPALRKNPDVYLDFRVVSDD